MLATLLTDEELLRRFAAGEDMAFEQLYRRHRRRLWGMARKIGWDLQQAEDILVEAMAAVAVQARRGRIHGSFIGYALTAVHHRGLHVIERSNERKSRQTVPMTLTLVSGGPSPEEALVSAGQRSEVAAALDALPAEERASVYMVDCQGLTYKETALALSCSEATVKRRLRAGRKTLARRLHHLRPGGAEERREE
jgi:RNA polymerase sigma-70 factor (ECF subfamily)